MTWFSDQRISTEYLLCEYLFKGVNIYVQRCEYLLYLHDELMIDNDDDDDLWWWQWWWGIDDERKIIISLIYHHLLFKLVDTMTINHRISSTIPIKWMGDEYSWWWWSWSWLSDDKYNLIKHLYRKLTCSSISASFSIICMNSTPSDVIFIIIIIILT